MTEDIGPSNLLVNTVDVITAKVITTIDVLGSIIAMEDQEVPDQDLVTQDLHHPVPAAFHIRAGISMISSTRMASGSHLKVILLGIK
jgi:hypothetical protein